MSTFLYPHFVQFPFDEVIGQIVKELKKRNWNLPDIRVEFLDYGTGEEKYRMVDSIKGKNFFLGFGRQVPNGQAEYWDDCSGVTHLIIPEKELNVFVDESGPSYHVYAGKNWKADANKFFHSIKCNSKLRGVPKYYLTYHGNSCFGRATKLIHTNDLNREYDLGPSDPEFFYTKDVYQYFTDWLADNVLKNIKAKPLSQLQNISEKILPVPEAFKILFCIGDADDAQRIKIGKIKPAGLPKYKRFGMQGTGRRLVSLGNPHEDSIPDVAYDGFLWCGIGQKIFSKPGVINIAGYNYWCDKGDYVIQIYPKKGNGIYVADFSGQIEYENSIYESNPDRYFPTNDQLIEMAAIPARTIVPINQYSNKYKSPVVLINRELDFDEVVVIGKAKDF